MGTLIDGYTSLEEIVNIANVFWNKKRDFGKNLQNLCASFASHYAMLRGESFQKMELADMHSINLENEGLTS